ncbi:hypothetical protein BD626DRAFT_495838, partial [Schizophyllum amplum]
MDTADSSTDRALCSLLLSVYLLLAGSSRPLIHQVLSLQSPAYIGVLHLRASITSTPPRAARCSRFLPADLVGEGRDRLGTWKH